MLQDGRSLVHCELSRCITQTVGSSKSLTKCWASFRTCCCRQQFFRRILPVLAGESLDAVAEVVYIPIYVKSAPEAGVQAVVEVVISSSTREAMVVANLISFVSDTLNDLKVCSTSMQRSHTLAARQFLLGVWVTVSP